MARIPALAGLLYLAASSHAIAPEAPTTSFAQDATRFVPSCAQGCFLSFLAFNYGVPGDGTRLPTLGWLCSTPGESEYTVGEGAIQCLVAEKSLGSCSQEEANALVISRALHMCKDQPRAIQPTHGVVTATLILPPDGSGGQVSFPPPRTTRSTTRTTRAPPRITSRPSSSANRTRSTSARTTRTPTSLATRTRTRTTSSAVETDGFTGVPIGVGGGGEVKPKTDKDKSLTAAQKAGIAVGVLALAGLLVAAAILFKTYRGRQTRPPRSDSTEALHRRETWGYKFDKGGSGGSGNSWLANPVHPHPRGPDAIEPPAQSTLLAAPQAPRAAHCRPDRRPGAIGLAITGARSGKTTPPRPLSKLLPARPGLGHDPDGNSPTIPDPGPGCPQVRLVEASPPPAAAATRPRPSPSPPPKLVLKIPTPSLSHVSPARAGGGSNNVHRDSAATEFEEDGRPSASSASPEEGQVWRPPSSAVAPLSATACYVADKHGNWVLCDAVKRVSHVAEIGHATPVTPLPPSATAAPADQPPPSTSRPSVASAVLLPAVQRAHKVDQRGSKSHLPANHDDDDAVAGRVSGAASATSPGGPTSPEFRQYAVPRPLFSSGPVPRFTNTPAVGRAPSGHQTSRGQVPSRIPSNNSGVTTFAASDDDEEHGEADDDTRPLVPPQGPLTPVTESPRSGPRPSAAVTYPRIADRSRSATATGPRPVRSILRRKDQQQQQQQQQHPPSYQAPGHAVGKRDASTSTLAPAPQGDWHHGPDAFGLPMPGSGSATVRLVDPSPSPESQHVVQDDRARLPSSSRPRHASVRCATTYQNQPPPQEQQQHPAHARPPPNWTSGLPAHPRHPSHHHQWQPHAEQQSHYPPQRQARLHHRHQHQHNPYYCPDCDDDDDDDNYHYPYAYDPTYGPDHHPYSHPHPVQPRPLPDPLAHRQYAPPVPRHPDCDHDCRRRYPHHAQHHQPVPHHQANPHQRHHHQHQHPPVAHAAAQSSSSLSSSSSSLIAKRLGPDRAAHMSIATGASRPWRRRRNSAGPLYLSPELVSRDANVDEGFVPAGPPWVPRLTPTRRGDNMYLNVQ